MNDRAQALFSHLKGRTPDLLDELRDWVGRETPSHDKPALDALGAVLADRLRGLGGAVESIPNPEGGDHLLARFPGGVDPDSRPVLIVGHFDTVWPAGTLESMPFRVEDGRVHGPGVLDMKGSLAIFVHAMLGLRALGIPPLRPILALWTADEELGSPHSRPFIEAAASESHHALVIEPALADGGLKTARKGVGRYTLDVAGRAAHAGIEPEKGISAVAELAHQVLAIQSLNDFAAGTSVTVGTIRGGTASNVVPASARAQIDVRMTGVAEAERIDRALHSLTPALAGTTLTVSGGVNRPPMVRTPAIAALFERARTLGSRFGLELTEGMTGGGSDANFTAAAGLPTLDGLGGVGAGAHAPHEHALLDSLPERATLLALLLSER